MGVQSISNSGLGRRNVKRSLEGVTNLPFGLARVVFAGGMAAPYPTDVGVIEYVQATTLGNAINFGNLIRARSTQGAASSSTRGIIAGGYAYNNGEAQLRSIEYVTIATLGNATSFGNLSVDTRRVAGTSSETRALIGGGYRATYTTAVEFVTIASTGNASNFGNLSVGRSTPGALASPTRAIFGDGDRGTFQPSIDYFTIATTGNATNFGNITGTRTDICGSSNSTRGLFAGGWTGSTGTNIIDYITIATTGNAIDFGDLTVARSTPGASSSKIRALFAGGSTNVYFNTIDYVTIDTTGNAIDFGDLSTAKAFATGFSDGHGGLG